MGIEEQLYQELIEKMKTYHPTKDFDMVEKAYRLAVDAHKDQKRKSGEPYIIHPLKVAYILAELELDRETIIAGILHDVIEDTVYSYEDISRLFSEEIAILVDGVTKLGKLSYSTKEEIQAENYRKMFLAMAKDIRVILIKLADRLHNMRTLDFMTPAKQKEKAQETLDIYAPLAHRLGISKIRTEMEDLCFKYLNPDAYFDLEAKIEKKRIERESFVNNIVQDVQAKMDEAGIKGKIEGRSKHFFSIYKKMVNQNKTLDQIYDLFAVRAIVDSVRDCYGVLGIVHTMYKPMPGHGNGDAAADGVAMDHGEDGLAKIPHLQPQGVFAPSVFPALHHIGNVAAGGLLQIEAGGEGLFSRSADHHNAYAVVGSDAVKGAVQPLHHRVVHGVALFRTVNGQLDHLPDLLIEQCLLFTHVLLLPPSVTVSFGIPGSPGSAPGSPQTGPPRFRSLPHQKWEPRGLC